MAVFDLKEGRVVFSSDELKESQYQWYNLNGSYFFTAAEWLDTSGKAHEKKGVAYFYDSRSHKIIEKAVTIAELAVSIPVVYDFEPGQCEDCAVKHNKK